MAELQGGQLRSPFHQKGRDSENSCLYSATLIHRESHHVSVINEHHSKFQLDEEDNMDWTSSPSPFGYDGARSLAGSMCSSPFLQFSPSYASGETDSGTSSFSPSIFSSSQVALNSTLFEKKMKRPVVFDRVFRDATYLSSLHDNQTQSACDLTFRNNYFLTQDDKPYNIVQNSVPHVPHHNPGVITTQVLPMTFKTSLRIEIPNQIRDLDDEQHNFSYPIGPEVPVTRSLLAFEEADPLDATHDNSIISWGLGNFYCVRDVTDGHLSVKVRNTETPECDTDPFSFDNMTNRSILDSTDEDDSLAISSIEKRRMFSDEVNAFTSPLGYLRGDEGDDRMNAKTVATPTQCKCKKSQCLKL